MSTEARLRAAERERDELRAAGAALADVPERLRERRAEVARLQRSPGWRLTAPLRLAKRVAIRLRRRAGRR